MDFWARLIGGVGSSPTPKHTVDSSPQQRLAQFRRIHGQLLQTWRNGHSVSNESAQETVRALLQRLNAILHEESHIPPPHPCLNFASSASLHTTISQIGSRSSHNGVTREVINAFSTLIDGEDDFLHDDGFAQSLVDFVRNAAGTGSMMIGEEAEGDIIELMFGVAAKIRLQPDILPVWFTARHDTLEIRAKALDQHDSTNGVQAFAGITKKEDFPLFYLLIDYVHHEGRVGDFARTGLLYIIESASISEQLEHWIIESDLATLMASGLGALYSQLSRKLVIAYSNEELPAILALYPSLLESSDIDGGSAVAVLTYLRRILESLDHPELIHLILEYLLALPEDLSARTLPSPKSPRATRRRKTLDFMAESGAEEEKPTPTLFNLVDLIITSLRSRSQQTKSAALKLVSVILRRHHRYALSTLIHTKPISYPSTARTVGAQNKEMNALFSLVAVIGSDDNSDASYENHLKDNLNRLECHSCTDSLLNLQERPEQKGVANAKWNLKAGPREVFPHMLRPEDPLLKSTVEILEGFFSNAVETNLNLTAAIVDLAACGYMNLEGWLVVDPDKYEYDHNPEEDRYDDYSAEEEEDDVGRPDMDISADQFDRLERSRLRDLRNAQREPRWTAENTPPILATLQSLTEQVKYHRARIRDFDTILAERKQAFQVSDEIKEALATTTLPIQPKSNMPATPQHKQRIPLIESRSQNRISEPASQTGSRSSSPRGRPQSSTPARPSKLQYAPLEPGGSPSPSSDRRSALSPSPSRDTPPSQAQPPSFSSRDANILSQKIICHLPTQGKRSDHSTHIAGGNNPSSSASTSNNGDPHNPTQSDLPSHTPGEAHHDNEHKSAEVGDEISVSHFLTNTVILQEFILELAALIQVRSSLFADVKFLS
ncbi:MAG: hypothetical protein M1837_006184 [Sclerophora amabilis]|nr:MAG: hypothetical protein M1837_006184 [Sclerophora amabilis]